MVNPQLINGFIKNTSKIILCILYIFVNRKIKICQVYILLFQMLKKSLPTGLLPGLPIFSELYIFG